MKATCSLETFGASLEMQPRMLSASRLPLTKNKNILQDISREMEAQGRKTSLRIKAVSSSVGKRRNFVTNGG